MRRLLAVGLLLSGCAPAVTATPPGPAVEIVGALVDRSGPAGEVGQGVEAGLTLAADDINAALTARQAGFRLQLQVEDVGGDPLAAYQRLRAAGVRAIVGPVTSEAASALMAPATADGVVLLSPSSTAPSLAREDNLLRFAPVDVLQGVAIARAMGERGVKAEIVLARDDVYGRELAQEVEFAAGLQGITHLGTLTYPSATTDFAPVLAQLKAQVSAARTRYGADAVAVELVSYSEAAPVFKAAAAHTELKQARWFGCDGNARAEAVKADAAAASFAREVKFLASTFVTPLEAGAPGEVEPSLAAPAALAERASARLGHAPGSYVYTAYDALWCLAQTREELGGLGDPARVKSALYARSQSFKGTAGPMALNPQGDRMVGTYGFFGLGAETWKLEALYGNTTYQRLN